MLLSNFFKIFWWSNLGVKQINLNYKAEQRFKNNIYNTLHFNLKQLEFISRLEDHLDKRKEKDYALEFLEELHALKFTAQKNTIKSINSFKKETLYN